MRTVPRFMETYSGVHIPIPFDTDVNVERDKDVFLLEDIAHSLSNICRYGGHSQAWYSVAEHSVRVALHSPPELALEGLLHDATEAYMSDIISPIKPFFRGYVEWENSLYERIAAVFGIQSFVPPEVDDVDKNMCRFEIPFLLRTKGEEWSEATMPMDTSRLPSYMPADNLNYWNPADAKREFLSLASRLLAERRNSN